MSAAAKPVDLIHPGTPERVLGDDGGRAYRRFLAWTVGDGFAMAVVEVRSPGQRRELLAWTSAEMPGTRVVALDQASGKPLWPLLEQACPSPGGADILVLTRLEEAADRIKLCARLNIQRDELAKAFPVPWVVLVHPAAALELQQHAPDFSDFAGLWLNEDRDETGAQSAAAEQLGLESMSLAAPMMPLFMADGSSGLMGSAYDAIVLSKYDEAVDLLAQYDMRHPHARIDDPKRIRLDGLLIWLRGKPLEGLARLEEARRLCAPSIDRLTHAEIIGDIARIRGQQGEIDIALELHNQALQVYETLGDDHSRAVTLGDLAHLRTKLGEVDVALALHKEALSVYETLGDRRSRALTLGDIARLRTKQGDVNAALDVHRQSLQVYEELGDSLSRAIALIDIARLRAQEGDVTVALDLHHQALKIFEKIGNLDGVANARWSIGELALRQGDQRTALEQISASYDINNKLGRLDAICVVGMDLALVLLAEGRETEALEVLARARDGFLRLGRPDQAQQVQAMIDTATDDS